MSQRLTLEHQIFDALDIESLDDGDKRHIRFRIRDIVKELSTRDLLNDDTLIVDQIIPVLDRALDTYRNLRYCAKGNSEVYANIIECLRIKIKLDLDTTI